MRMRPSPILIATVLVLALASAVGAALAPTARATARADATGGPPVFVLTGAGYGHGVGMSQWGAFAQARDGKSAADILGFYYPGTEAARRPGTTVRVLLRAAAAKVTIASSGTLKVRDYSGATHDLVGPITLAPDLSVTVDGVATPLLSPLTFTPGAGGTLSVDGRAYRGRFQVTAIDDKLQVLDVVALEAYLQGVVPGEMPSGWPAAALQAQAIAARSYALATLAKGKAWDLYPGPRSQQYLGAASETPQTTAAVRATAGQVLLYGGTVATTLYSASSGGQTASGLEAFGLELPYLPSQADPWDAASPYHQWQPRSYTGKKLAKLLGLSTRVVDVMAQRTPSLRVETLALTAADGTTVAVNGVMLRKKLGLRSTSFRLATLRFLTPASPTTAGAAVRLTGIARDAEGASLERRDAFGTWTPVVRRLAVSAAGTFAAVVRPSETTTYRLTASGLPGPALTIPVVGAQP
jgi:stage II sporulation protein D